MKKTVLFFILCSFVLFLYIPGCTENKTPTTGEDFSFTTLTGETKHLSDYRGSVVILDMWATWCTPCQYQMLELRKIYQNYSRDDVEILSINIDQRETVLQIQSFLDQFSQYGYELNWDFGKDEGTVWETYQVGDGGIPALCIFSRNGTLSFSHEGLAVYNEIPPGYPDDLIKLAPVIENLL